MVEEKPVWIDECLLLTRVNGLGAVLRGSTLCESAVATSNLFIFCSAQFDDIEPINLL